MPRPPKTIQIKRSERVLFTGRTGSGKTTLADRLIRKLGYRTVVIDPKHSWDFPGYRLVTKYDPDPNLLRQVFRPIDDDWDDLITFLNAAWRDPQPLVLYVDELTEVTTPRTAPAPLRRFVRLGRQRNKATWYATQRPKDIPSLFLTEAEHWMVFDLRHADDRDKVAGFLGDRADGRPKGRYSFWYANPDMDDPIHFTQPPTPPRVVAAREAGGNATATPIDRSGTRVRQSGADRPRT